MHSPPIRLSSQQGPAIRTINEQDLENLRAWKNANRAFFFHHAEILPEQQLRWYAGYIARPQDYMFVVEADRRPIGCMGIRLGENEWDVYNVILGATEMSGRGLMARAFQLMLGFAYGQRSCPITLKVLKHNPAIGWYQKNGFQITADVGDYLAMLHARAVQESNKA